MPKPCIFPFNAGHIIFTNNVVSLVNKLGINNVNTRSIKKLFHPLIIFHKGLNVSAELSPIVRAKIPADPLFRAVHSQILFFYYPQMLAITRWAQLRESRHNLAVGTSFTQPVLPS
jgi:hypothetical protein